MTPDQRALRSAASHHQLIHRATARRLGLSDRQIRTRVATGRWSRESADVFAVNGAASSVEQHLLAAAWGSGGLVSHLSAAWLLDLVDDPPAMAHVTVGRPHRSRLAGAKVHRSRDLEAVDRSSVRGVPCTNATRTLIDAAGIVSEARLRRLIESALQRSLTHPDQLVGRHLALARPGRPGSAAMRRALRDLDHDLSLLDSDLEAELVGLLRAAGMPRPVLQHEVTIGERRYRIDLCYPDANLAIEGDGFGVHGGRSAFESDRRRQNDLILAGWRILRFTWRQICSSPDDVIEQISTALSEPVASGNRE